jgi:hypothetical protein
VAAPFRIEKEIGFTHAEFFRLLPILAGETPLQVEGTRIVLGRGPRRIEILLDRERERVLSPIVRIPYTPLQFVFYAYSDEDQLRFERHFERVYHKGGG